MSKVDWNKVHERCKQNETLINNKIEEVKNYIESTLSKTYLSEVGLVYTKLKQDIENNQFYIWIDKGINMDHKLISFNQVHIEPLQLLEV